MSKIVNKPIHICHLIFRLDIGGLERVLVNLINELSTDFKHTIICIERSSNFSELLNKDVDIISLNKIAGREFTTHRKIFHWLLKNRPDVVHSYNLPTIEYQAIAWLCRIPVRIHAEHGREMDDIDGNNRKRNLLRKLSLPFINQVVSVSRDLTDWLQSTLSVSEDKITFIANGIDTNYFSGSSSVKKGFLIGAVGRIDEVKNHQVLIELCKVLQQSEPQLYKEITFEVVGDGPKKQELESLIASNNLQEKIILSGKSLNVVEKLVQFNIFIQPSKYEAMPMTILEAMSCGLPVVASNVGGIPDIINHNENGMLFDINSVVDLSICIASLCKDEGKQQLLSVNARNDVVRNYSSQSMAKQYSKLYNG